MDISIPEWNPCFDINKNFSMALVASRRSGKTTMLKFLVNNYLESQFDEIILLCNTAGNEIYDNFTKTKKCIKILEFDEDVLKALIMMQQENSSKKILIILDDMVGNNVRYSNAVLRLFCTARNLNISIIYSVQSATLLLPDCKENLDYLIILKIKTFPKIKHIIDTFLIGNLENDKIKTTKQEFEFWHTLIKKNCKDFNSLVVNYLDDNIYKYKIDPQ